VRTIKAIIFRDHESTAAGTSCPGRTMTELILTLTGYEGIWMGDKERFGHFVPPDLLLL